MSHAAVSGSHEHYVRSLWLGLEANRSMFGMLKVLKITSTTGGCSDHSVHVMEFFPRDRMLATVLVSPLIWAAWSHMWFRMARFHNSNASAHSQGEWVPPW